MSNVLYVTVVAKGQDIERILGIYDSKQLANTAMMYERARTGSLVGEVKVVVMELNQSYAPLDIAAIHEMVVNN